MTDNEIGLEYDKIAHTTQFKKFINDGHSAVGSDLTPVLTALNERE